MFSMVFTFNGKKCSGPIPITIEGVVYGNQAKDFALCLRHIEGYCEDIPSGQVKMAFNIGNCAES